LEDARGAGRELLLTGGPEAARWSLQFVCVAHQLGLADGLDHVFKAHPPERIWDASSVAVPLLCVLAAPASTRPWSWPLNIAVLEERFDDAAIIATEHAALYTASYLHLLAARAFSEAGRRADAHAQLERAVPFFRAVGATHHLRAADAVLSAIASVATQ